MNASLRLVATTALGAVVSLAAFGTAVAAGPQTGCRTSDPMRTTIMSKADEGADALRRYVTMTRAIHQMDMHAVAESIDRWRAEAGCAARAGA